jgi:VWFA-related protein
MKRVLRIAALPLLVLGTVPVLSGAAGQRQDARDPSYVSQATAVLVDVVVRDRQGRPLLDLKADDFEVLEDNVAQDVGSFTLVQRGAGIGIDVRLKAPEQQPTTIVNPDAVPIAADAAPDVPSVLALVFDSLSAESMGMCQRAALDYVKMNGETGGRIGVFVTDPYIRVLQRYTDEPALIRTAVQRMAPTGEDFKSARAERLEQLRARRAEQDVSGLNTTANAAAGTGNLSQSATAIGQAEVERRMVQAEMRMLQAFDSLDRDHRGYGTTNALLAVIESMTFLPGRKSVVFFSEGLPASPAMQSHLQSVIEGANRSNITVYAVDASGLRVVSGTTETRKEIQAAGDERLRHATAESLFDSNGPLTKVLERTEDLMRFDSQGGLARLAEDTGGFLVRDTNDIGSAFKRIDEDMRFHYLLTYSPRNDVLDGKFRTIAVKVKRPGVVVYSRKGYRAVRTPGGLPVLTYEAPALALLDASPLPNAFPTRASAFMFPEGDRPGLTPIVVRVTTDALQFDVDSKKNTYSAQAAVVVRIRDDAGQVVQKLSQQYVLSGDAKEIQAAKAGEILFYREVELAPGAYKVESLVYDAVGEKGSGRVSTVTVPGSASPKLRMSSVVVVSRTEQTPGRAKPAAGEKTPPFYYGDTLLYPNLGEPLTRGADGALSFYFVVYPVPGRCACTAHIALLRNGRPLAEADRTLTPADQARLQHVGQIPIGNLPAGTYELRITVTDTLDQQSRSTFFTVA